MTNEKFFEHAIDNYPKSLGIGIHLNLTWDNSLITNKPFFKYNKHLAVLGLISKDKAEKELRKQIETLLERGIRPDHLDTHHHIHAFPPIKQLVINLAKESGADAVKFQNFKADKIVSDYGFKNLGDQLSHQFYWKKPVYEVFKDYSIPLAWTKELKRF